VTTLVPVSSLSVDSKASQERDLLVSKIQSLLKRAWRWHEDLIKIEIAALLLRLKEDEQLTPPQMWWVSSVKKNKYGVVVLLKERWKPFRVEFHK